jgi:hypothetical protein
MALEAKITEIAEDTEDVRKNYGLRRFKEIAERMVEGIQVIFLANPEAGYTEESIGVVPFTQVFQRQDDPTQFTLAASPEEAEDALGGAVTGFDISVASQPKAEEFVVEAATEDEVEPLNPEDTEAPNPDDMEFLEEVADDFESDDDESDDDESDDDDTEWGDVDDDDSVDYEAMDTSEIKTIVKDLMGELVDAGVTTAEATKAKCQELKAELLDTRETAIALCKYLNKLAEDAKV